jgi:hypothetical protein
MMVNKNIETIKQHIFINGKMVHYALNTAWYEKNNILHIKDLIYKETSFLDQEAPLRERIFYIEKTMDTPVLCTYCNVNQTRLIVTGALRFQKSCKEKICLIKHKSKVSTSNWKNMDDEKKRNVHIKIGKSNKGKKRSEEYKETCRQRNLGLKQSEDTKRKRVETRKNNGNLWFSEETLKKLSESNRKTHLSKEFREKHRETYNASREKISNSIKKKILLGQYTPKTINKFSRRTAFCIKDNKISKFRSSWEAIFWLVMPNIEYETIRVSYNFQNKNNIYIIDFVDFQNKILYEIKPDSEKLNEKNLAKFEAAKNWAKNNGYIFEIITEKWFQDNLKNYIFSEENKHLNLKLKGLISKKCKK